MVQAQAAVEIGIAQPPDHRVQRLLPVMLVDFVHRPVPFHALGSFYGEPGLKGKRGGGEAGGKAASRKELNLKTAIEPRNDSKNHEKAGIPIGISFTGMVNGIVIEIPIVS
jgi:hypothetical protein